MGATNNIRETNITLKLDDKSCDRCSQKFTDEDIKDNNFDLWFDTTNEVELVYKYYPRWTGAKGYQFSIWIRSVEHQTCPEKDYD